METYQVRFSYGSIEYEEYSRNVTSMTTDVYIEAENEQDLKNEVLSYFESLNAGDLHREEGSVRLVQILAIKEVKIDGLEQLLKDSNSRRQEARRKAYEEQLEKERLREVAAELQKTERERAELAQRLQATEERKRTLEASIPKQQ